MVRRGKKRTLLRKSGTRSFCGGRDVSVAVTVDGLKWSGARVNTLGITAGYGSTWLLSKEYEIRRVLNNIRAHKKAIEAYERELKELGYRGLI